MSSLLDDLDGLRVAGDAGLPRGIHLRPDRLEELDEGLADVVGLDEEEAIGGCSI